MVGPIDIVIVTVLAIGASVLIGVLGYFMDKIDDEKSSEAKPGDASQRLRMEDGR